MRIRHKDYELHLDYRLPHEFIFCAWRFRYAIKLWLFHSWTDDMRDLWFDVGFRCLGFEIIIRQY